MFTVKYRTLERAKTQPVDGPTHYHEHEQLHGPFEMISQEYEANGYMVVHAHRDQCQPGITFGPFMPPEEAGNPQPRPTLWVMNAEGATVARYDL